MHVDAQGQFELFYKNRLSLITTRETIRTVFQTLILHEFRNLFLAIIETFYVKMKLETKKGNSCYSIYLLNQTWVENPNLK